MWALPTPRGTSGRVVDPEGKVVARHRSPQGRRSHLGLPLPPVMAAAGAGAHALASPFPSSLVPRMVATVVAGGALAAAGQAALGHALPAATEGANVLKLGVQELLGAPAGPAPVTIAPASPAGGVAAEPHPVDVSGLVKAAERAGRTTRATPSSPAAPTPRAVPATPAAPRPPVVRTAPRPSVAPAPVAAGGAVQLVSGRVTSGFGLRWGRPHRGLDIAAPIGTPIRAPLAGDVIAAGPASGFGLWVRVRHDDGTVTTYGHVNRTLVRVGQHAGAGQEIAEVGNRGDSTGPHLHIEVETPAGVTVNPRPWLDAHGIGY
jgi:murein DD-endopeptidase MepM/ murein hydrolase activator NlpD